MKVSNRYYDEVFDFEGQWGVPSKCGLKIFDHNGTRIVVVTELYQDNPGTSVTYAGRSLLEQICRSKDLEVDKVTYVECNPDTGSKLSFYDEECFEVDFDDVSGRAVYHQIDHDHLSDYGIVF